MRQPVPMRGVPPAPVPAGLAIKTRGDEPFRLRPEAGT